MNNSGLPNGKKSFNNQIKIFQNQDDRFLKDFDGFLAKQSKRVLFLAKGNPKNAIFAAKTVSHER